jgi:hypothetical protein
MLATTVHLVLLLLLLLTVLSRLVVKKWARMLSAQPWLLGVPQRLL